MNQDLVWNKNNYMLNKRFIPVYLLKKMCIWVKLISSYKVSQDYCKNINSQTNGQYLNQVSFK